MKKILVIFFSSIMLFLEVLLQAEVQNVVITWNAAICLDLCIPRLESNIRSLHSVADVQISPTAGTAEIQWAPTAPFSFAPLNFATRSAGINIHTVRVRVKGVISHDAHSFYITSMGDGTPFLILGTPQAQLGYIVRSNVASYPISEALRQQLLDAELRHQVVTIEGPLFRPYQYSLAIIAEQVSVPPPKAAQVNKYMR